MEGGENNLAELLKEDEFVGSKLSEEERIEELLDPSENVGDVSRRCQEFIDEVLEPVISEYEGQETKEMKY